jgi:TolB-like protein
MPVVIPNGELIANNALVEARPATGGIRKTTLGAIHKSRRFIATLWGRGALSLGGLAVVVGLILLVQNLSLKSAQTHGSIRPTKELLMQPLDEHSLAVLPFTNLSGDPKQEYFSDGITDDLITDLSRVPKLFVIARTSSFTYKGRAEKAQSIGRELGVKYLLEGSTRRAGDQVRINVQLVDAATGTEVWSQRYDRQMRNIFKLQDEIVQSLTTTIGLQLSLLENGIPVRQQTNSLAAYDYFLRGFEGIVTPSPDTFARSRVMLEQAIALDPRYAEAYGVLGLLRAQGYGWQWDNDADALDRAEELARKSVSLDDSDSNSHAVLGWIAVLRNHPDQAIAEAEQAITLDPNNAFAYAILSDISGILEKPEARLVYAQKAMRIDPRHSEGYLYDVGAAYNHMGRYTEAVDALKAAQPNNPWTHLHLIYAYTELGREADAKAEARQVLRLVPHFSLEAVKRGMPGDKKTPYRQRFLDDLREAGLT